MSDLTAVGRPAIGEARADAEEGRRLSLAQLSLLALVLGVVTGVGAVLFRDLIGVIHNVAFTGRLAVRYDANVFTAPSPWGALVILVPVIGGVIVTFLVDNFAPEAKGHGVPEVMDAIFYKGGVIRPVVALVKSLASAVAIGTGSSVGREGPIIQIGSALGSTFGQLMRMPVGQRITLVAAGAGAGIAATFNTPIGGVMFAVELMLPEVSVDTFLPVAIATGAATFVGRWFLGDAPAFRVPPMQALASDAGAIPVLLLFAALGALTGVAAAGFIRGLHLFEDVFDRIGWRYLRHILGMLLLGVMMYVLFVTLGQYYVDGVGYATVEAILTGRMTVFWLLGLLCLCKAVATSLSLGSGSSGGIFSPSLFMGATLGGGTQQDSGVGTGSGSSTGQGSGTGTGQGSGPSTGPGSGPGTCNIVQIVPPILSVVDATSGAPICDATLVSGDGGAVTLSPCSGEGCSGTCQYTVNQESVGTPFTVDFSALWPAPIDEYLRLRGRLRRT